MAEIQPIVMPKWGLAMQEGMLATWHVAEGARRSAKGQEIADIETSKIANAFESPVAGTLRRRLVGEGETLPVGALLASSPIRRSTTPTIDAFVAEFQANFAALGGRQAASGAGARARRGRRPAPALPQARRCRRHADPLHPRLRRRSQQLAVQPAGAGREATPPTRSTCPGMAARARRSATATRRADRGRLSTSLDGLDIAQGPSGRPFAGRRRRPRIWRSTIPTGSPR